MFSVVIAVQRKNIVIVGDSILSRIEENLDVHTIIGRGCRFWDARNPTWTERLFTPLSRCLRSYLLVKVLIVHLGANDTDLDLVKFKGAVCRLLEEVRYTRRETRIILSHILPRCPFKYNEREEATTVNFKIDTFNDAVDSIADTEGVTVLAHPEYRDMINESHFWQDAIRPTPAGARILGESFKQEIRRLTRTPSPPPRGKVR